MSRYAEKTSVSVESSKETIRKTLERYGASNLMQGESPTEYIIAFELSNKRIKLNIQFDPEDAQERRRKFRVLLLMLKARLECIDSGDSTVEQEFMPNIMLPDGTTVGEQVYNKIEQAYSQNEMPKLMIEY